jgi:hypothetical protein
VAFEQVPVEGKGMAFGLNPEPVNDSFEHTQRIQVF